jgi:hypothetical protein
MPKERRINVRAKGDLKDRLRRACQVIGATESSLIVACVESLVNYIESHGEITLPIMVVPKSVLKKTGATSILTDSGGSMTGKLFVEGLQASSPTNKNATNSDYAAANSEAEVPLRKRREATCRRKTRRTQTSHSRQSASRA